jgi:hypothetical protein
VPWGALRCPGVPLHDGIPSEKAKSKNIGFSSENIIFSIRINLQIHVKSTRGVTRKVPAEKNKNIKLHVKTISGNYEIHMKNKWFNVTKKSIGLGVDVTCWSSAHMWLSSAGGPSPQGIENEYVAQIRTIGSSLGQSQDPEMMSKHMRNARQIPPSPGSCEKLHHGTRSVSVTSNRSWGGLGWDGWSGEWREMGGWGGWGGGGMPLWRFSFQWGPFHRQPLTVKPLSPPAFDGDTPFAVSLWRWNPFHRQPLTVKPFSPLAFDGETPFTVCLWRWSPSHRQPLTAKPLSPSAFDGETHFTVSLWRWNPFHLQPLTVKPPFTVSL